MRLRSSTVVRGVVESDIAQVAVKRISDESEDKF